MDIEAAASWSKGSKVTFPIIADPKRDIANLYGMMDPAMKDDKGLPLTCRGDFFHCTDCLQGLFQLYLSLDRIKS